MQKHCLKNGNTHQAAQARWALNSVLVTSNALSAMVNILNVLPTGFASNSGCFCRREQLRNCAAIYKEISPGAAYLHSGNGKCVYGRKNSLKKCADKEKTRSFFVISPSGIVLDRKSQDPHHLDTIHWAQSLLQLTTFEMWSGEI